MSFKNRLVSAIQRALPFLAPKPEKTDTRSPVAVAQGQSALTAEILAQDDAFNAALTSDPVYQVAKRARDKAKHQKKRFLHHQDAMTKRMTEILAAAKAKRDAG
jgi:hypothetical protein